MRLLRRQRVKIPTLPTCRYVYASYPNPYCGEFAVGVDSRGSPRCRQHGARVVPGWPGAPGWDTEALWVDAASGAEFVTLLGEQPRPEGVWSQVALRLVHGETRGPWIDHPTWKNGG